MKYIAILLILSIFIIGCAETKTIDGITYDTYGLFNKDEKQNPTIQYELVWGNIIWGAVFVQTVVAPIYFYGFSLWEPVGKKTNVVGQVIN